MNKGVTNTRTMPAPFTDYCQVAVHGTGARSYLHPKFSSPHRGFDSAEYSVFRRFCLTFAHDQGRRQTYCYRSLKVPGEVFSNCEPFRSIAERTEIGSFALNSKSIRFVISVCIRRTCIGSCDARSTITAASDIVIAIS